MKTILSVLLVFFVSLAVEASNLETRVYTESGTVNLIVELPDSFVLIASDISIPLILPAEEHLRLVRSNGGWQVSKISDEQFSSLSLTVSTTYNVHYANIDGDRNEDLVLQGTGTSGAVDTLVVTGLGAGMSLHTIGTDVTGNATSLSFQDTDRDGLDEIYFNGKIVLTTFSDVPVLGVTPGYTDGLFDEEITRLSDYSVGEIPSSFSVNQGVFSFNLQVAGLPSANSAIPAVGISYSNSPYDGQLGQGFSISAGGAISRCSANYSEEGYFTPVNFTNTDKLCLNGQKLKLISGTHLQSGAEYRTELDSGTKIIAQGNRNGVAQYFKVWTRDGRLSLYGETNTKPTKATETAKNRLSNTTKTIAWHLSQESDLSDSGNAIDYYYSLDPLIGEHFIDYILYGWGNKTDFIYAQKAYPATGYSNAMPQSDKNLLKKIVVADQFGVEYRQYSFDYFTFNGKQFLEKIDVCAQTECLVPTSFNWSLAKGQVGIGSSGTTDSLKQYSVVDNPQDAVGLVLDLNQDNIFEVVDNFNPDDEYEILDFNNDGYDDFLFLPAVKGAKAWLLESTGNGFNAPRSVSAQLSYGFGVTMFGYDFSSALLATYNWHNCVDCSSDVRRFSDVNGDGYPDAIIMTNLGTFGTGIYVALNVDAGGKRTLANFTKWSSLKGPAAATIYKATETYDYYGRPVAPQPEESSISAVVDLFSRESFIQFYDVNGDNYSDFLGISSRGLTVLLSDGQGQFVPIPDFKGLTFSSVSRDLEVLAYQTRYELSPYGQSSSGTNYATGYSTNQDYKFPLRMADVNGDGLLDFVNWGHYEVSVALNLGTNFGPFTAWITRFSSDNVRFTGGTMIADIHELADVNGDGLADLIELVPAGVKVALSNGERFLGIGSDPDANSINDGQPLNIDAKIWSFEYSSTNPSALYDANGDGKSDLVKGRDVSFSTGEYFSGRASNYVPFEYKMSMDINGDGQKDIVEWNAEQAKLSWTLAQAAPDYLLQAIHYGTGRKTLISYATQTGVHFNATPNGNEIDYSLSQDASVYKKTTYVAPPNTVYNSVPGAHLSKERLDAYTLATVTGQSEDYSYPLRVSRSSGLVVASIMESNGVGGYNKQSYQYKDQVVHLLGRGVQGYKEILVTNEDTEITTKTQFDLHYPLSGTIKNSSTIAPNGNVVNEELSTAGIYKDSADLWHKRTVENTSKSYDLNSGELLLSIEVKNIEFDSYDNATKTEAVIYDEQDPSKSYTTESTNSYDNNVSSNNSWWLGKVASSSVSKWDSIHGLLNRSSKSAEFQYYRNGLLEYEIAEPNSDYQSKTVYTYDAKGNRLTTATTAKNRILSHNDKSHLSLGFTVSDITRTSTNIMDTQGIFLLENRNDLYDQWGGKPSVKYSAYNLCGMPTVTTNVLGQSTVATFDEFCNQTSVTAASNTDANGQVITVSQQTDREWASEADGDKPNHALFKTTQSQREGGASPQVDYQDILGRNIRSVSKSFDGSTVYVDSEYDMEGHLAQVSRPYFPGDTVFWIMNEVDDLGRVTVNTMPGPIGGRAITTTGYDKYTTRIEDNEGHSKISTIDARGNLIRVDEPMGAYVEATYNGSGQLIQMDTSGQKVTYSYDQAGRKSSVFESNQGTKYFEYNGFGQLIWQMDNKGQIVEYRYDAAGRPWQRFESHDGIAYTTTTWRYFTTGPGIGQIAEVANDKGYSETKVYDALGRAVRSRTQVDGEVFTSEVVFDDLGRVLSNNNNGFETLNTYNPQGFHESIKTLNNAAEIEASYTKLTELKLQAISDAQQAIDLSTFYAQQEALYRTYAAAANSANTDTVSAALKADLVESYRVFSKAIEVTQHLSGDYASLAEKLVSLAEQIEYQSFRPQIAQNLMRYYDEMSSDTNLITLWKGLHRDAGNRLTSFVSGNGILNTRTYDPGTAQLKTIEAGFGVIPDDVLRLEYRYDRVNNVTSRTDYNLNMAERFGYDALDRMVSSSVVHLATGLATDTNYHYDINGNITFKSGIGNYSYGSENRTAVEKMAGPNAVTQVNGFNDYSYDANGNMLTGGGRTLTWTSFDKPKTIRRGDTTLEFFYTPSHMRYKQVNGTSTKYYYGKAFEKETITTGAVRTTSAKYFLYANGELVGTKINTEEEALNSNSITATTQMRYMHTDALGSIAAITDANGTVVDRLSFDAHGKRRLFDWRAADPDAGLLVILPSSTTRGFTGHEHLDDVGLIHMNGRLYDPEIGRFISADPTLQFATNSQNHNRYSYVGNNPMKYVDKDGYGWFKKLIKKAKRTIKKVVKAYQKVTAAVIKTVKKTVQYVVKNAVPVLKSIAVLAVATVISGGNPILAGMIAGGINGALTPGASLGDVVKGAVIGGISAAFSFGIGHGGVNGGPLVKNHFAKAALHGGAQGTTSVMRGGSFKDGMVGGFMGSVAPVSGIRGDNFGGIMSRTAAAGMMGGITAELTGGSFEDGLQSAAFTQLFNDNAQKIQKIIKNDYLSWEEADQILVNNNDPDLIVAVRADMLVVKQTSNFYVDPKTVEVRAGGMVMGIPEYLVHGQVTIRDRGDGTYGIYQQQYNFEQRPVNNVYDVIRNVETFVGGVVSSEGTPFWIQYDGNANVIKK